MFNLLSYQSGPFTNPTIDNLTDTTLRDEFAYPFRATYILNSSLLFCSCYSNVDYPCICNERKLTFWITQQITPTPNNQTT